MSRYNILLRSGDKKQPKLSLVTEDTKLNTKAGCPCVSFVSRCEDSLRR